MLNFQKVSSHLKNVGDGTTKTPIAPSKEVTEGQAILLRKASCMAILKEYALYQIDKGDTKMEVLRKLEEQTKKAVESLYLPSKMSGEITRRVMDQIYRKPTPAQRVMTSMVENIKEINKEDPGGDDAGIGLPEELKAPIAKMKEYDKVIDESEDLVVEKCGNKFILQCFQDMRKDLPADFVRMMSA